MVRCAAAKSKIKYTSDPSQMEVVEDFLPPPESLVRRQDIVKVTIGLSKPTVEFFKTRRRRTTRSIKG